MTGTDGPHPRSPRRLRCVYCCAGLTAVLLAGVMDLRAMAVLAAVVAAERIAPAYERVAHAIGAILFAVGLFFARGLGILLGFFHLIRLPCRTQSTNEASAFAFSPGNRGFLLDHHKY